MTILPVRTGWLFVPFASGYRVPSSSPSRKASMPILMPAAPIAALIIVASSKLGTSFLSAAQFLIPNSLHSLFTSSFGTYTGSFISPPFLEYREDQKSCYDITRLLISNVSDYCLQNGTHKLPAERLVLVLSLIH